MSAIFGIFHLNGKPVDTRQLQRMQAKLVHYGHDQQAFMVDKNIGLGCCLNTSIDPHASDVPFGEQEDLVALGDSLIYNRGELTADIAVGEGLTTQALLLKAYRKWGLDCAKHINGDFVFAIWDKQSSQLIIFRDHLGVRPLYYFFDGAVFAFATDFRALLVLPFVGREFDEVKLYATVTGTYHIDPEATYFAHIKCLRQAHLLKVDPHGLQKQKYWTPAEQKVILKDEADYAAMMYDLVSDAINIRLARKVQIGAELSGGLDSSVIVVLANRTLKKEGQKLTLFSWSPPYDLVEQQPGDERQLIELVCRQEGLSCHFYDYRLPLAQDICEILPHFEEGHLWQQEYQFMTEQGVKIILSGWGGDQAVSLHARMYDLLANGDLKHFGAEAKYLARGSLIRLLKIVAANTVLQAFNLYRKANNPGKDYPDIANAQFAAQLKHRRPTDVSHLLGDPVRYIESSLIQTRTELTAWLDSYHGVQHVYPFLDYRVVDFALSVPRYLFIKHGLSRYLFRAAFTSILPPEVRNFLSKNDAAKYKHGFDRLAIFAAKLRLTAGQLRRDLFAAYIDWEQLEKLLDNPLLDADLMFYVHALFKIHPFYYLQEILAETDMEGHIKTRW